MASAAGRAFGLELEGLSGEDGSSRSRGVTSTSPATPSRIWRWLLPGLGPEKRGQCGGGRGRESHAPGLLSSVQAGDGASSAIPVSGGTQRPLGASRQQDHFVRSLNGHASQLIRPLDAGPGGARVAGAARSGEAVRALRAHGLGREPSARRADRDRAFLTKGRRELKERVQGYLSWLHGEGRASAPRTTSSAGSSFSSCGSMRFSSQLELFHQVISQRSESEQGVWLSGLDVVAADALALPEYYEAPPVICYLDRGIGGAIRRARTRMPGGGENPVAVIRIPRERMIGSGIASSLVHETGHQAAALLGLVPSLRAGSAGQAAGRSASLCAWRLWERWISEIVSDFWSVARVGVVSTLGLIGVVSLPRPFVFRINVDDPHPTPWIRVKLSCAIGDGLYPHPQWQTGGEALGVLLSARPIWTTSAGSCSLASSKPSGIRRDLDRSSPASSARPLAQGSDECRAANSGPARGALCAWNKAPQQMYRAPPSLVFAVLGPGEGGRRPQPRRRKRSLGEASHLLGDAQHARYFGLLRRNSEIESASVSSVENIGQRRHDNGTNNAPAR